MPNFDLERLKAETSILDFGEQVYGYTPKRKRSNYWGFKEFDSLMVSVQRNCFWHNNEFKAGFKASSSNNSAGSIIDFIMHIDNCQLDEAIEKLKKFNNCNTDLVENSRFSKNNFVEEKTKFIEPIRYYKNDNARNYLCNERKISIYVFNTLVKRKLLYEEKGYYRNAIFCSYDETGKMIFAQRCSTRNDIDNDKRKFDVSGSSYKECYFINNNSSSLIVTEATIDTLSFMSLLQKEGKRFNNYNHLATSGSNKIASALNIINKYPHITTLYVATDNDEAGDYCYQFLNEKLSEQKWCGKIVRITPTVVVIPGKAFNSSIKASWDNKKAISLRWSKVENCEEYAVYCKDNKKSNYSLIYSGMKNSCKRNFKYCKNYFVRVRGIYYDSNGKKQYTDFSDELEFDIDCTAKDINDILKKNIDDKQFYSALRKM